MITNLWPTPVFNDVAPFSPEEIDRLAVFAKNERILFNADPIPHPVATFLPSQKLILNYQFSLLENDRELRAPKYEWEKFKQYVDSCYRRYLAESYGLENTADIKYVCRVIPVYQQPGERTLPHYHHTCDHVMCVYLKTGENKAPLNSREYNRGDGELILCDPRAMASFPFWEKIKKYDPYPGFCVIHPSQIWHETNTHHSDGDRILLVVTLRVESHNYKDLYQKL